jgi:nucleoside-diphosphate-sugar epimerase
MLDITKAETEFGFKAKISLEEGLKQTIKRYMDNYKSNF